MSIQRLPDAVITQIKSSATITTLNSAVCGLLKNSFDAGASKIAVSVDYIRGSCSIDDDGHGILPAEFMSNGGLGKLHFTSKYPLNQGIHGKHGVFLASLGSLSLLSITSHHCDFHSHNSIQIYNSDILARHTPSRPDQRLLSVPHGTRVTVRDLFGSMPVRVKQRAIDAERGVHSKHWEILKRDIVALTLAWGGRVSISVREHTNHWAYSVCSRRPYQDSDDPGFSLMARVSGTLYQAGLADEDQTGTWVPLRASAGGISVTGAVSLLPVLTKRVQFISLGIQPVPNEYGSNILYEEINRVFSNSNYGFEEGNDTLNHDHDLETKDGNGGTKKFTAQELRGRKGLDRWPMFFIKIQVNEAANSMTSREMDEFLEQRHEHLAAMVDILKAVAYEFLKKYRFCPTRINSTRLDFVNKKPRVHSPKKNTSSNPGSMLTTATRKKDLSGDLAATQLRIHSNRRSGVASPFDFWSRIKAGSSQQVPKDKIVDEEATEEEHQVQDLSIRMNSSLRTPISDGASPLFGSDGSLLRAPFETTHTFINKNIDQEHRVGTGGNHSNEDIRWTDPVTKKTSTIDPRTGFVVRSPDLSSNKEHNMGGPMSRKRPRLYNGKSSSAHRSAWLGELLSSWENPVFKATEPQIPTIFNEESCLGHSAESHGCGDWLQTHPGAGPPIQGRVTKSALCRAEIVAQVDQKFILVKVLVNPHVQESTEPYLTPHSTESLLVIIDQHAADERCRVESLMASYFEPANGKHITNTNPTPSSACAEILGRPLRFDFSARDAMQLKHAAPYFAHWGIHYHVTHVFSIDNFEYRQVEVTKLPPSIAERCRTEPRLLAELLRKESWKVNEHGYQSTLAKEMTPREGETGTSHWSSRFHGCPQGILDMINSRACRSAIMFNDALSVEECTGLVKRLANCAFPFQCAHGRPSMVPLVDLGNNVTYMPDEKDSHESFGKAFKKWKRQRDEEKT